MKPTALSRAQIGARLAYVGWSWDEGWCCEPRAAAYARAVRWTIKQRRNEWLVQHTRSQISSLEIYRGNEKRYRLSQEAFKQIAGKAQQRDAYLSEMDSALREDGYVLVDLREEQGCLVIVKQSVLAKYEDLSAAVDDHFFVDEEWDEE